MARMEVTPSMMISIANDIKGKMEEWDSHVAKIYQLYTEMAAMWEGPSIDAFKTLFEEDRQKFARLSSMMAEYQNAVIAMADEYSRTEDEAKAILSRR